ncbi:MAG: DUF1294 domain-containing protein [Sandaracinaceae bacterium]|nr:DUF1294 domain-containing protein [Sandaracinaceae bacterium]
MARSVPKTSRSRRVNARGLARGRYGAHIRRVLAQLSLVLVAVNVLTACVFAYDKWRATRGGWRVRERTLLGLAALGGAAGALLAMRACRHKTRKPAFRWGVPALLVLQAGLASAWLLRGQLG